MNESFRVMSDYFMLLKQHFNPGREFFNEFYIGGKLTPHATMLSHLNVQTNIF